MGLPIRSERRGRFEKAEANLKNTLNEVNDRLSKIDKKDCRKKEILSMRI